MYDTVQYKLQTNLRSSMVLGGLGKLSVRLLAKRASELSLFYLNYFLLDTTPGGSLAFL